MQGLSNNPAAIPALQQAPSQPTELSPRFELSLRLNANQTLDSGAGYISGKFNRSGIQVAWWQEQLNKWLDSQGAGDLKIPVNGKWDARMERTVRMFQDANGLDDDGIIGPRTFRKMAGFLTRGDPGYLAKSVGVELIPEEQFKTITGTGGPPLRSYFKEQFSHLPRLDFSGADPFEVALQKTLKFEGGYANDPRDSGGETNFGITQDTYDTYRAKNKLSHASVKAISQAEVKQIYHENYWLEAGCDKLPPKLGALHFDAAVNHGVGGASNLLHKTLRSTVLSLGAVQQLNEAEQDQFVLAYTKTRDDLYEKIVAHNPSQNVFAKGWDNRNRELARSLVDPSLQSAVREIIKS